MGIPKNPSATVAGAKSRRGRFPKAKQAINPILTPKDASIFEKHFLWLWARYLHTADSPATHAEIAGTLGITAAISKHRLAKTKELVAAIQKRAQIELGEDKDTKEKLGQAEESETSTEKTIQKKEVVDADLLGSIEKHVENDEVIEDAKVTIKLENFED
ncbi:hypothetical protein N7495_006548 [Penicillium taxi]|uniref:uncharacterized protein n=1 Tax=Penicillium taxi TaxID=168475 RepID=UPI0025453FE5|nr:uncharacterized protein N7495_006548 [Penicillium taxi]KAJ5894857.1 hypothetical protein N7495_006548 [Penicillium taxi]